MQQDGQITILYDESNIPIRIMIGNLMKNKGAHGDNIKIQDENDIILRENYMDLLEMDRNRIFSKVLKTKCKDLNSIFFNKVTSESVQKIATRALEMDLEKILPKMDDPK